MIRILSLKGHNFAKWVAGRTNNQWPHDTMLVLWEKKLLENTSIWSWKKNVLQRFGTCGVNLTPNITIINSSLWCISLDFLSVL